MLDFLPVFALRFSEDLKSDYADFALKVSKYCLSDHA